MALEASRRPAFAPGETRVIPPAPAWIIPAGLALALVAVLGQVATQLVDFGVYGLRIAALNSNVHGSVFGVASLVAQGVAAGAAVAAAVWSPRKVAWSATAVLVVFLLVARLAAPFSAALMILPVAVVFVLYWRVTDREPSRPRTVVRAGLGLLVFSFVVHAVGPTIVADLGYAGDSWPYQFKGILKHSAEMAGWIVIATGTLTVALAARSRPRA